MFQRFLRLATIVIGCAVGLLFILGLPGIASLPGWFYRTHVQLPLGPAFMGLVLAATPVVVSWALERGRRGQHALALSALMLLGMSLQFTLHFLVPQGIGQSLERLSVGHGEFVRVAAARRGQLLTTLRDYDGLFARGELGAFAGSKGPGTLAVYMLIDALAQLKPVAKLLSPLVAITRASPFVDGVANSAALILVLFPFLTWLTLAPLVALAARLLGDRDAGYGAALLLLTSPAMLLIDLHLDGALYPLVGIAAITAAVAGARSVRAAPALLGGVLAMLGIYCTFGLIPCAGIALAFAWLAASDASGSASPLAALSRGRVYLPSALFVLGASLCLALLVTLLDYRPFERFAGAIAFHTQWKGAVPTRLWRGLSLLEFALYAGAPLMFVFVVESGRSLRDLALRAHETAQRRTLIALVTLTITGALAVLAATQGTNEVARLWLFMVPPICLTVAACMRQRDDPAAADHTLRVLAAAQLGLTLLMRVRQVW